LAEGTQILRAAACQSGQNMRVSPKYLLVRLFLPALLLLGPVPSGLCVTDSQEVLLQTTGALCAQGLYLTYTSVGTLADGYVKKVYDKNTTNQYLSAYIEIIKRIRDQLGKLQQSGALKDQADSAFVAKVLTTYELLSGEATAFQSFLSSGAQDDVDVYTSRRKDAWKNIQEILGINS
jgi:hypothetical protein